MRGSYLSEQREARQHEASNAKENLMWSITMSPALATAIAQQQTLDAVHEAGRARQVPAGRRRRARARTPPPRRRTRRLLWTRGLVGRAAH